MFDRRGLVAVADQLSDGKTLNLDLAEEFAIECGAEEVEELDGEGAKKVYEFYCDHHHFRQVKGKLTGCGCSVLTAEVRFIPREMARLNAAATSLMSDMEEKLMETPYVIAVHTNVEVR
jgi:transcriptional/translational regulatory protein YebC/TACO1